MVLIIKFKIKYFMSFIKYYKCNIDYIKKILTYFPINVNNFEDENNNMQKA